MFITISSSIRKALFFTLYLFLIVACSGSPSSGNTEGSKPKKLLKKSASEEEKEPEVSTISNDNVRSFLLQYGKKHPENEAVIHTSYGDIRIRLYNKTPLHRANFVYLTNHHYWDGTWFYRVTKGHVIQAGNTDDRKTVRKREAIGDYLIPAEIHPHLP